MKVTGTSTSGILLIMMSVFLDTSSACAVYEPIVNERARTQPEKLTAEESLLNFKIEQLTESTQPSGCAAAQRMEDDRRRLDPQLSASDRRNVVNSASQETCKETEFSLPMNQ